MNIFHKIALQGLKKSRTRTLVTVIGVALSAALITAVTTFAVSLQSYLINGAAAKYGGWHMELPDTDASFVQELAADSRAADVTTLQNIGYAKLEGGRNPDKPYLFLSGWNEEAFRTLPLFLLSGRLPENSSEVVISSHIAANGGVNIAVGDTLSLPVGSRMRAGIPLRQHDPYDAASEVFTPAAVENYTVVGICRRPGIEEYAAPGYTVITALDASAGDSLTAFITLKDPYQIHSYADSLPEGSRYLLNDDVLRFMGLSGEKLLTVLLYCVGGILIALVMAGSVFLIYNSFHIALNERTHQFGLLLSAGATERQLRNSVLFEGLCIAAMGIPIGILAGIPAISFVLFLVRQNFANAMYDNVPLTLVVSAPILAAAAVISLVTILISAYLPAKKAAGTPVMECIRQTNEVRLEAGAVKTSSLAGRLFGLEETLALKNFKRNKRRYRSIILSLTLSVVLFVTASSFGTYLNQIAEQSLVVTEDYDICFYTREMEEAKLLALYDELKTADGVTESSYQALSTYACVLNTADVSDQFLAEYGEAIGYDGVSETVDVILDIQFVTDSVYQNLLEGLDLSPEKYSGRDNQMIMAGILPEHWYTQEQPMTFTIGAETGTMTFSADFVTDYPDLLPSEPGEWLGYRLLAVVPYECKPRFDALDAAVRPTTLGMTFRSEAPGQSTAMMQAMIDADSLTAGYTLYNVYGLLDQNRNLTFIINLFSSVFIAMISLIAVANVFNTISTNIKLRRRELAMLRSVGMSDRDFNKMMRFECLLYGTRTMLYSLPLSGILSFLIYRGMTAGGGTVSFVFPFFSMAGSMFGVFIVVFITMLYAVHKIKRENIIDALRDDLA